MMDTSSLDGTSGSTMLSCGSQRVSRRSRIPSERLGGTMTLYTFDGLTNNTELEALSTPSSESGTLTSYYFSRQILSHPRHTIVTHDPL